MANALNRAKKQSNGEPLSKCLKFANAIGFLFEDPDNPIYGNEYILVYEDGSVTTIATNPEGVEFLQQGTLMNIDDL